MARACWTLAVAFLLTWACPSAQAQDEASPGREQVQRLSALCKVWGAIRHQHPYLAYKDVDWDAALVRALPKIEAAKTGEEFAAAVQVMLDALGDPATRVVRKRPPAKAPPTKEPAKAPVAPDPQSRPGDGAWFTRPADGVLAIDLSTLPELRAAFRYAQQAADLKAEVGKARGVIIDCRRVGYLTPPVRELLRLACPKEVKGIATRYVVHSGYRAQTGETSGGYYSAFETAFSDVFIPLRGHRAPRSVWLIGDRSAVPGVALALQSAGAGFIVVQGEASEDLVVPQRRLPLAEGFEVLMRTAELVTPEGEAYAFRPDAHVPADAESGADGPAYKAALALLKDAKPGNPKAGNTKAGKRGENGGAPAPLPAAVWRPDKTYADTPFPDRAHRLLALFRFWTVIHYFYPYKHLLDQGWDTVLPEFLPKFLAARDEREYVLTVSEMATRTQDDHTFVSGSAELRKFFGEVPAPVRLRWIENAPVVVGFWDEKAAKGAGARIGDVVVKVDGEPVAQRMERLGKYVPASTPDGHKFSVLGRLLSGAEGSTCKLTLRGPDDAERDVELPRRAAFLRAGAPSPAGREVFEILPGNLGYVDLTRLERGQIDDMLEKLRGTKGIIFDMRGYPRGVFFALAPRLNVKNAKYAALFQRPVVRGAAGSDDNGSSFRQPIEPTDRWKYQGKTVLLIDERAISQAEHTGLFLEAACGPTFIGSHTAGANGDVTYATLPGGLTVGFGGHDVRHADGRQLQRVGLTPHIEVKPTIRGIREGTDEVLERAIKFIQEGR
jgi:C-terminal processing protease CtpA/Prc